MNQYTHIRNGFLIAGITTSSLVSVKAGDAAASASTSSEISGSKKVALAAYEDWEMTGAAGFALADGNAQSLAYSLQLLATQETASSKSMLGADYFYADNQGLETTNTMRLFGQHTRTLTERLYAGVSGAYLTDEIAELDYRLDLNPIIGYHVIKNDRATLSFELGPGYTWEDQGGAQNDFMNILLGQRFEYRLNSRSKFWQSLSFVPEASDFDNHMLTAEVGIDTLLTSKVSLRTFIRHRHDNTPAAGQESGDTTAMVGLAYSLGGFPEPKQAGRATLKADRAPSPIASLGWVSSAALGYTLASGNADNALFTAMGDAAYRSHSDEFFLNGAVSYGENNGTASIDNIRLAAQYNRIVGQRYFYGAGSGFLRDDLASLDYRFTPAAVAGVYLIKNDIRTLSLEAGPGYTFEKTGGITSDYLSLQAAQRFIHTLSPRSTLNQSIVYNGEVEDPADNFNIVASAFLDTDITDHLALRIVAAYTYDNTPAAGRERHDTTLTSGIAIKF